mmetsp:Transcript_8980/g.17429  ORF Transcript_8980/g.17429 Transcript_8980/m.17429 type:complete len:242 (-) Transcript_8980:458-1183(-)
MTSAFADARWDPLSIRSGRRVPCARKTLAGSSLSVDTAASVTVMKVSPMIILLSSGAIASIRGPIFLPLAVVVQAFAKSCVQLTTWRSIPTLPSATLTVSLSCSRMKPWSTCTACTRLGPMASRHSAAQTEESTPPETRTRMSLVPTASRISSSAAWWRLLGVYLPARPAILNRKFLNMATPCSERSTSGWNCTPNSRFSAFSSATMCPLLDQLVAEKPGASFVTESPCVNSTVSVLESPL